MLNSICESYNYKAIFSIHPRTRNKLKEFDLLSSMNENIIKMKPLDSMII